MAKRATAKDRDTVVKSPQGPVDGVAEYIGTSLADLMNRKDALLRQVAAMDQQIAALRRTVAARVSQHLPALPGFGGRKIAGARTKKSPAGKARTGKRKRPLPPDDPAVAATERATTAQAKARAAQRARTLRRSGGR